MGAFSNNFYSFLVAKPPMVTFLVSMLAFSVTMFCLAFYVQQNNRIKNIDILDWNRLLQEMSRLRYCLCHSHCECQHKQQHLLLGSARGKRDVTSSEDLNRAFTQNSTAALANISINTRLLDKLKINEAIFRGIGVIPLDHFGLGHDPTATVTVALQQEITAQNRLCVEVSGEHRHIKELLRNVAAKPCPAPLPQINTRTMCVHSANHLPHSWCQNGTVFDLDYQEQEQWVTYLTPEERGIMHLHLMATAAFLFTIVLFIIGLALVRGASGTRTMTSKHVGDSRGDMELLSSKSDE